MLRCCVAAALAVTSKVREAVVAALSYRFLYFSYRQIILHWQLRNGPTALDVVIGALRQLRALVLSSSVYIL